MQRCCVHWHKHATLRLLILVNRVEVLVHRLRGTLRHVDVHLILLVPDPELLRLPGHIGALSASDKKHRQERITNGQMDGSGGGSE